MLKLRLQYLTQRANSLEKTLMLGKIEGKRRRGQQRMTCLDSTTEPLDRNLAGRDWGQEEKGTTED